MFGTPIFYPGWMVAEKGFGWMLVFNPMHWLIDAYRGVLLHNTLPAPFELASDRIQVSTASEIEWLDNIIELDWQLYLCSSPPFLLQTAVDRRMHDYTQAALDGRFDEAREISRSPDPVQYGRPEAQGMFRTGAVR